MNIVRFFPGDFEKDPTAKRNVTVGFEFRDHPSDKYIKAKYLSSVKMFVDDIKKSGFKEVNVKMNMTMYDNETRMYLKYQSNETSEAQ